MREPRFLPCWRLQCRVVWLQLEVRALRQIKQGAYGRKFLGVETLALQTGTRKWSEKIRQLIRTTWKSEHVTLPGQNSWGQGFSKHTEPERWQAAGQRGWGRRGCAGKATGMKGTLRNEVWGFYTVQISQSFADHAGTRTVFRVGWEHTGRSKQPGRRGRRKISDTSSMVTWC